MRKHFISKCLFLLMGVGVYSLSFGQEEKYCGSTVTTEYLKEYNTNIEYGVQFRQNLNLAPQKWFPVYFHIIRRDNGTGGITVNEADNLIGELNTAYAPANIQFFRCGLNFIDNEDFYSLDEVDGDFNAYFPVNFVDNVINFHISAGGLSIKDNNGNKAGVCGFANFPGTANGIIAVKCIDEISTTIHEFGHYFGLLHTHQGGNELVTRAVGSRNCHNAGDWLCDTDADPQLSKSDVNTGCAYTGTATDANGDTYTPPTTNIMAYGRKACRTDFTSGQYAIINNNAFNHVNRMNLECRSNDCSTTGITNITSTVTDQLIIQSSADINASSSIDNDELVLLYTSKKITMKHGFKAAPNSGIFEAKILSCESTSFPTSVSEFESNKNLELLIAPNPSDGMFNIMFPNSLEGTIEILNLQGKVIFRGNKLSESSSLKIDLSNQSNGLYLIQFKSGSKNYHSKISIVR